MNDQLSDYRELVESIAKRFKTKAHPLADFDDLVQEGLIAVWRALEDGVDPVGPDYIRHRIRDYVRALHRPSRHEETLPYDDEAGRERSGYSERERLSRAGTDLDEAH